jgi:hypothetical protein
LVFYMGEDGGLTIAQHIGARAKVATPAGHVALRVEVLDNAGYVGPDSNAGEAGDAHRPSSTRVRVEIDSDEGVALSVRVRVPEWITAEPALAGDARVERADGALIITHPGARTSIDIEFPFAVRAVPIPDEPTTVAFVEGPVVLAGLVDREVSLRGDASSAATLLTPDNERQWAQWLRGYRTVGQTSAIRFRPLHEIVDEPYSVYFPINPIVN